MEKVKTSIVIQILIGIKNSSKRRMTNYNLKNKYTTHSRGGWIVADGLDCARQYSR